jgi:hypothetical protein
VAFEKHRIRLRMAAGAWRDYHESIHARLTFVHSCTADAAVQEDLRRADERQERVARNLVQSFTPSAEEEEEEEEDKGEEWISQMLQYKTFVCNELTLSRRSNQWLKGMYVLCVCVVIVEKQPVLYSPLDAHTRGIKTGAGVLHGYFSVTESSISAAREWLLKKIQERVCRGSNMPS